MRSSAEVRERERSRSRGAKGFLTREALRGLAFFLLTSGVFWWMGAKFSIPAEFARQMTIVIFLIWIGGGLLYGALWWLLQERRYASRMRAQARGEVPVAAEA